MIYKNQYAIIRQLLLHIYKASVANNQRTQNYTNLDIFTMIVYDCNLKSLSCVYMGEK